MKIKIIYKTNNKVVILHIFKGQSHSWYQSLMKAEKMLKQCENQDEDNQEYNNAASITYNNIGWYYQK